MVDPYNKSGQCDIAQPYLFFCDILPAIFRQITINQSQEGDRMPLLLQLLRHLVSNQAASRPATKLIGSLRLELLKRDSIVSCNLFQCAKFLVASCEIWYLYSIK